MGLAFSWTPTVWLQSLHPSCLHTNILSPLTGEPGNISTSWTQLNHVWWAGLDKWKSGIFYELPWIRSQGSLKDIGLWLPKSIKWATELGVQAEETAPGFSRLWQPLSAQVQVLWGKRCVTQSGPLASSLSNQQPLLFLSRVAVLKPACTLLYSSVFKCTRRFQLWTLIFLLTDMSLHSNESSPHLSILEIVCIVWWGMRNCAWR